MTTTEDHDERITAGYKAREEARAALTDAADHLRAEVLASDYGAPELAGLLTFSVSSARQLIDVAMDGD